MIFYYFWLTVISLLLQVAAINNSHPEGLHFNNNACYSYYDYPFYPVSKNCFKNEFVLKDTPKLIELNGYKYLSYDVTTDDGYIITIFRIFKDNPKGQPVYIQHGIGTDSSAWVQNGKHNSLSFVLVEAGFDVWLGNLRVTQYGKRHISLSPKDSMFWNFSLDELSGYDLRNCLQKVGNITGQTGEIIYIGHSMGTTLIFMYASKYQTDNLLKGICTLSPIVYFTDTIMTKLTFGGLYIISNILKFFNINALFYENIFINKLFIILCKIVPYTCLEIVNLLTGKSDLFLPEHLTTYYSYFPDTIALNQIIHTASFVLKNKFQKFDYGSKENMRRYNAKEPPLYDLSKITLPALLFYGRNDPLLDSKSTINLFKQLGSTKKYIEAVPIDDLKTEHQFAHIQFLIGANLTKLFFKDLVSYLKYIN